MNRPNSSSSSSRHLQIPAGTQHRRGRSLTVPGNGGASSYYRDTDENLDLFSKNRRTLSVASSDESSDASVKLGRLSLGKMAVKSGTDDLLSSEIGKHDYDWLLTPPGTPLVPSSNGSDAYPTSVAPRSSSLVRSSSTTKASRLSVAQTESNHISRPARSSSVTRSAVSASQYSTYSSNRGSNILNTSSASVSSYIRPSSPISRSPATGRPSTPSTRTAPSRPVTPSRTRPSATSSTVERTRPSLPSRPSTPTSRPQIPANLNSPASRTNSRPSTPTRRISAPSLSPATGGSISAGRSTPNGRASAPSSRASSPSPRVRAQPQPIVLPDFPHDTPPNLRTTLPDRPLSAGRSRPSLTGNTKANTEPLSSGNVPRRQPSPIVTRGRLTESTGRGRPNSSNGHVDVPEYRKAPQMPELTSRRPVRTSTAATESTGFGRTISKKSLDMAIKHMDIRNGTGNIRPLSGTTLFPQSIRSVAPKTQSVRSGGNLVSANNNGIQPVGSNGVNSKNGSHISRSPEIRTNDFSARLREMDIYESSRYEAILLKEDLKNTNWLHSLDDRSDHSLIFDNGFEHLPEPFSPL